MMNYTKLMFGFAVACIIMNLHGEGSDFPNINSFREKLEQLGRDSDERDALLINSFLEDLKRAKEEQGCDACKLRRDVIHPKIISSLKRLLEDSSEIFSNVSVWQCLGESIEHGLTQERAVMLLKLLMDEKDKELLNNLSEEKRKEYIEFLSKLEQKTQEFDCDGLEIETITVGNHFLSSPRAKEISILSKLTFEYGDLKNYVNLPQNQKIEENN